jgi:hypothetical protein
MKALDSNALADKLPAQDSENNDYQREHSRLNDVLHPVGKILRYDIYGHLFVSQTLVGNHKEGYGNQA